MKSVNIRVNVPDVKFKQNDIIRVLNESNSKKYQLMMVDRVLYYGTFMICQECGNHVAKCNTVMYNVIAQPHSWDSNNNPMRPGKIYQVSQEIRERGEIVYDLPRCVSIDCGSNIMEREKVWRDVISKIRNGDLTQFDKCI